jgi:hypothetical protein
MKPCGLFASRDTLEEAYAYSESLISALPKDDGSQAAAYTALWVVLNTALAEVEKVKATPFIPPIPNYAPEDFSAPFGKVSVEKAKEILPGIMADMTAIAYLLKDEMIGHRLTTLLQVLVLAFELDKEAFKNAVKNRIREVLE